MRVLLLTIFLCSGFAFADAPPVPGTKAFIQLQINLTQAQLAMTQATSANQAASIARQQAAIVRLQNLQSAANQ